MGGAYEKLFRPLTLLTGDCFPIRRTRLGALLMYLIPLLSLLSTLKGGEECLQQHQVPAERDCDHVEQSCRILRCFGTPASSDAMQTHATTPFRGWCTVESARLSVDEASSSPVRRMRKRLTRHCRQGAGFQQ